MRADFDAQRVKLDTLRADFDAQRVKLDALRADFDAQRVKFDALRADFDVQRVKFDALRVDFDTLCSAQALPNVIKLRKKPFFVIARRNAEAIYKITDKTLYGLLCFARNDGL
ncbi:MAG: hypothetical protein LBJ63_08970, partial [Prevotellaceae bacterium]|nr:hypothetical protein [Prevotellaceae bacterium]